MSKLSGVRISQGTSLGDVERDCIGAALGYSVFIAQMLNELLPSTFILVCITPSGQSFSAYFFVPLRELFCCSSTTLDYGKLCESA